MKLQATANQHYQTVTAFSGDSVEINAVRYARNLLLQPELPPQEWDAASFEALEPAHFERIAALEPAVVILGTGARQRFIHPRLVAALSSRHVGIECMDSGAACRTYNILMDEGRKVLLALLLDRPGA